MDIILKSQDFDNFIQSVIVKLEQGGKVWINGGRNGDFDSSTFTQILQHSNTTYNNWAKPKQLYNWCFAEVPLNQCKLISKHWISYCDKLQTARLSAVPFGNENELQ